MDIHQISSRQRREARALKAAADWYEAPPEYDEPDHEAWAEHVVMPDQDRTAELVERLSSNDNAVELIYELMNGAPRDDRESWLRRWSAMLVCELRVTAEAMAREDLETMR